MNRPLRAAAPLLALSVAAAGCGSSPVAPAGGPTPAVLRSDDFERPDGPPGPSWAWQSGIGAPRIRGGDLGTEGQGFFIAWWAADAIGPDQFSEAVIAQGFDPAQVAVQVFVRRQPTGTPWRYGFHFNPGNGDYELKYDGGSPGVVLVGVPASPFQPGDTVRIEVQGNALRALVNGVEVAAATHDALAGGLAGLVVNPAPGTIALTGWASWRGGTR